MTNLGKIFTIGAACSACLAVPALIAAVGGTGFAAAGFSLAAGWLSLDAILCVFVPLALIAGLAAYQMRAKKAANAACAVDASCGCKDLQ